MKGILYTPQRSIQVINKVKDSKFYGSISRADSEEEVKEFIGRIRGKYHDATHNVSAYKLGSGDRALKYADDDGEPAGSSGPPVLQAIEGEGLTNTVIVVTRYFGGTKLGIGGLIRAYGDTARLAIKVAGRKKLELYYKLSISGTYEQIGTILGQIEACHGEILSTDYHNEGGEVITLLNPGNYKTLRERLIERTGNRVEIKKIAELYK